MEFPILNNNIPKLYDNEVLFLEKKNINFIIDEKSYGGIIYLSNLRLVFVSSEYSFDIPLANITEEIFNQPVFSSNNLSGYVKMIEDERTIKKWKIQFYDSVNTFLNIFTYSLSKMREYLAEPEEKKTNIQTPVSAFIDPNDSSILYVSSI
tara:strand:- start:1650 stop:2102 length:453 start_codon:yes stop_codon:yes gene_type:complete